MLTCSVDFSKQPGCPKQARTAELRLGRSKVHAWGLFAVKPIPAQQFVIEYVGELIRRTVNDVRERKDADSDYRFRVDELWVVDATTRVRLLSGREATCNMAGGMSL